MSSDRLIRPQRLLLKVKRKLQHWLGLNNKQVYLKSRVPEYKKIWKSIADELDVEFEQIDRDLWQLSTPDKSIKTRLHELPLDTNVVLRMCGRKQLIHKLLTAHKIPVPEYITFNYCEVEKPLQMLEQHPLGIVIKPCVGYAGLGISTHLTTSALVRKGVILASIYRDDLLAEPMIVGESHRLLVYRGQLLSVVKRSGDYLIGDGKSSLESLLKEQNGNRIELDDPDLKFTLAAQSLGLDFVPKESQKILVRSVGHDFNGGEELRTVYDTDVTDKVHPEVAAQACACTEILDAQLLGVDIITTDISKPLSETQGAINEVNTTPAFHHHYNSETEAYPKAALTIVKHLLDR